MSANLALASGNPLSLLRFLSQDFFLHSAPGYLGVDCANVDSGQSSALKLKSGQGVEIVAVDHDAPAAKAGLRIHDAIVSMNGHAIENCDQLRRLLHKQPPGRTVAFAVSRDGAGVNVTVQLADRARLEQQAWSQHYIVQQPSPPLQMGAASSFVAASSAGGSHFLGTLAPSSLYVGADVSPVRAQLAEYFGVTDGGGLLVENIDSDSPASRAGLRAGDVILKVNNRAVASRSDWFKAIRNNRGKVMQITIVRNKQQQTLSLTAGAQKKS